MNLHPQALYEGLSGRCVGCSAASTDTSGQTGSVAVE